METAAIEMRIWLLLFILFSSSATHKCKNPKRQIFPNCMFYTPDKSLWCDQSNYTEIPSVQTINQNLRSRDCSIADALFVNDSCLQSIRKDHLAPFTEITVFSGERNFVRKIPRETFARNKKLKLIDLCKNEIEVVENGAFLDAKAIEEISLSYNRIHEIGNAFRHLRNLKIIKMEYNMIAEVKNGQFKNLFSLEELHLTGNRIRSIENEAFHNLRRLSRLHLDDNLIENISEETFAGLEKLEALTLSRNRIRLLPEAMGQILINLQILHLGTNQLEKFNSNHIANATNLQILSLDNNKIQYVPEDLIERTPCLRSLNLGNNNIQDVPPRTFNGLCHLHSLMLQNNSIETPHVEWFQDIRTGNPEFWNLNISDNPWSCDCDAIPYWEFVENSKRNKDSLAPILPIKCSSPKFALKSYRSIKELIAEIRFRGNCGLEPRVPAIKSQLKDCSKCPESTSFEYEVGLQYPSYLLAHTTQPTPLAVMNIRPETVFVPTANETELKEESTFKYLGILLVAVVTVIIFAILIRYFLKRGKKRKKGIQNENRIRTSL